MTNLDRWFLQSLQSNNFAHSNALAAVMKASGMCVQDVLEHVSAQSREFQLVLRGKHDRRFRPGCHVNPASLVPDLKLADDLEEAYWGFAAEFDYESVFYFILNEPSSAARASGALFPEPHDSYHRFRKMVASMASQHGAWIGKVDIADFYGSVTGEVVYEQFGRDGLGLHFHLVDHFSVYADSFAKGLPQGPPLSDLIARLILTGLDRFLTERGIPYIRFADDILVFGHDAEERDCFIAQVCQRLSSMRLSVNPNKVARESPNTLEWVKQLVFWDEFDVRSCSYGYSEDQDIPAPTLSLDSQSRVSVLRSKVDQLDWLKIYHSEYAVGRPARSESGHRRTLFEIGRRHPEVLEADCKQLVVDRSSNIKPMLSGLVETPLMKVAGTAYKVCRRSYSTCDDHVTISRRVPERMAQDMARQTLVHEKFPRSTCQALLSLLPRTVDFLELATTSRSRIPWIDEHAAYALLLEGVGGDAARVARAAALKACPEAGFIYDAVASVVE